MKKTAKRSVLISVLAVLVLVVGTGIALAVCVPAPSGLVSWWPGDGNADDIWGTNHGTIQNGTTFAPGMVDQAFSFDGVDDYVEVPDSANLDITDQITIDAWFYNTGNIDPGMRYQRIVHKNYRKNYEMWIDSTSRRLAFRIGDGSVTNYAQLYDSTTIQLNTWYHVAAVYDGSSMKIYLNGNLSNSRTTSISSLGVTTDPVIIGNVGTDIASFNHNRPFDGIIDEVEIFDRALTAAEIQSIYINGKCKEPDIEVSPLEYDFGDVAVGSPSSVIATITNTGGSDLVISNLNTIGPWGWIYNIDPPPPLLPVTIPAGETLDLNITYTTILLGPTSAVLGIVSNDPDENLVEVQLSGNGVMMEAPPGEEIQAVLDYFDESVGTGLLVGEGSGNSASGRLNALRNMIEATDDLIADGDIDGACQQLQDINGRTDGIEPPPDFVSGDAAQSLASIIQSTRQDLGCN